MADSGSPTSIAMCSRLSTVDARWDHRENKSAKVPMGTAQLQRRFRTACLASPLSWVFHETCNLWSRGSRPYPESRASNSRCTERSPLSELPLKGAPPLPRPLLQPRHVVADELAAVLVVADEPVVPTHVLVQPGRAVG